MSEIITQQPVDWDCAVESTESLFNDDRWCVQEKIDGVKLVIISERGNLRGMSRSGRDMKLSAKTRAMMPAQGTFIIEGEQGDRLTGDTGFIAFDLISMDGQDARLLSYAERLELLATLNVPMVSTAFGTEAKRSRHFSVLTKGGEGIVFKRIESPYRAGKTADQLKLKNWRSDTFRVVGADGKGIDLETLGGTPAGRCPGYAHPNQLVEVRYQEVTEAGKLRSPVMIAVRDDL